MKTLFVLHSILCLITKICIDIFCLYYVSIYTFITMDFQLCILRMVIVLKCDNNINIYDII